MNVVNEFEAPTAITRFVAVRNGSATPSGVRAHLCPEDVVRKPLDPQGVVKSLAVVKEKQLTGGLADLFYKSIFGDRLLNADAA